MRIGVASGAPPVWTGPAGDAAHYGDQFRQAAEELAYNTAILLGRDRSLLATYRKVHFSLGETVAHNPEDRGVIWAGVNVDDHRSHWRGSTVQNILCSMRRPALYGDMANTSKPVGPKSERMR